MRGSLSAENAGKGRFGRGFDSDAEASPAVATLSGSLFVSPEAIEAIFDIASGFESTFFSFSVKSASNIHTPFAKQAQYFLAFFGACAVYQHICLLGCELGKPAL